MNADKMAKDFQRGAGLGLAIVLAPFTLGLSLLAWAAKARRES